MLISQHTYIHTDRQADMYFDSSFLHSKTKSLNYHIIPLATAVGKRVIWVFFISGGLSEEWKKHQSFKSWMISRAFSWAWDSRWCARLHLWGERVACGPGAASWALSLALTGPSSRCLRLKRAEGQRGCHAVTARGTQAWSNSRSLSCLLTAFCLVLSSVFTWDF